MFEYVNKCKESERSSIYDKNHIECQFDLNIHVIYMTTYVCILNFVENITLKFKIFSQYVFVKGYVSYM
jgi:hypothetical protein